MSETVHHAAISDGHDTLRVAFRYGRDPKEQEALLATFLRGNNTPEQIEQAKAWLSRAEIQPQPDGKQVALGAPMISREDTVQDECSYVPPDGLARAAKRLEATQLLVTGTLAHRKDTGG